MYLLEDSFIAMKSLLFLSVSLQPLEQISNKKTKFTFIVTLKAKGFVLVYWTQIVKVSLYALRKKSIAHVQALHTLSFSELNISLGFFSLKCSQPSDVIILWLLQSGKYRPAFF